MATSTIPAYKAALHAALEARVELRNVQVSYGAPLPAPADELVWLAGVEGEQEAAALGAQRREETFRLTIIIDVFVQGQNQRAATDRAFELMAIIETVLRADGSLGNVVRFSEIDGPLTLEEMASDTARGARLTIMVAAAARI